MFVGNGIGPHQALPLYNEEQTIFEACRPIILNGIEIFVLREDLANRTATVTLEAIGDEKRRDKANLSGPCLRLRGLKFSAPAR